MYDLDAQQEGDLSIRKDDRIEVLERTQDTMDWWKGRIGDRVGMFPGKIQLMAHFLDGMIHSIYTNLPNPPSFRQLRSRNIAIVYPHLLLFYPMELKGCFAAAASSNSLLRSHKCRKILSCRVLRRLYDHDQPLYECYG